MDFKSKSPYICLYIIITFSILLFSGCNQTTSNNNPQTNLSASQKYNTVSNSTSKSNITNSIGETNVNKTNEQSKPESNNNISNIETGKRKIVNDSLLAEFNNYIKKIDTGDSSKYNAIMAYDKYMILRNLLLSADESNLIYSGYNKIKYLLNDSIVYSGDSINGVHIIAIVSPKNKDIATYKDAVNKLRGTDDEFNFLSDILQSSNGRTLYYGVDIFAENLFDDSNKDIKIDRISLSNNGETQEYFPLITNDIKNVLEKYNRQPSANVIKNKGWSVFIFDGTLVYNPLITITLGNEQVKLIH